MRLMLWVLLLGIPWNPFIHRESRESQRAITAYEKGDYIEALTAFQKAKDLAKDPAVYDYNLGVAAHRAKNPNTAVGYYLSSRGAAGVAPGYPDYNLGNALFQLQKPEEALDAFRGALRADPRNEDARYNYEVLLRQMEADSSQDGDEDNQSEPQEDQKPQDQDQESQENQNEPGESENGGQPQEQESTPEPKEQNPAGENEGDQQSPQEGQPIPLDKQQAERLLNALAQGERDLLKARLKSDRRKRAEKDW